MQARILAMVLAGGKGDRLGPLTRERSKPAVPFGGKYRIIDFVLSNLINSGIYSIYVLTQFKAQSLLQHLRDGWQFSDMLKNQFVISVPARTCETGSPGCHKGRDWRYHRLRNVRKPGPQWTCDDRPVRIVRRSGAGSDLGTDQGRTRRDRGTHAALEAFEMATQSGGLLGVLDSLLGVEHLQTGYLLGGSQCAAIIALVELKLHRANQIYGVIERDRQIWGI